MLPQNRVHKLYCKKFEVLHKFWAILLKTNNISQSFVISTLYDMEWLNLGFHVFYKHEETSVWKLNLNHNSGRKEKNRVRISSIIIKSRRPNFYRYFFSCKLKNKNSPYHILISKIKVQRRIEKPIIHNNLMNLKV